MAIENVVALLQASQKNPELMAKLEAVNSSEQVVEIGAEAGFEFTTEEAEAFRQKLMEQKAEDGELTGVDLDAVAGGAYINASNAPDWAKPGIAVNNSLNSAADFLAKQGNKVVSKVFSGW